MTAPWKPDETTRRLAELVQAGRLAEAELLARQALQESPRNAAALNCLGVITHRAGQHARAVDLIANAIDASPAVAEHHYNLAAPLQALGRFREAEVALRQAVRLRPAFSAAWGNLGVLLASQGSFDQAVLAFRQAIALEPGEGRMYLNLGKALRLQDKLDDAEAAFHQAIKLSPGQAQPWNMLGSCLRECGRIGEAVEAFRTAINLNPNSRQAHSNLCYALHFDPQATPAQILSENLAWAGKFADPLASSIRPHDNDRSPERRLRIGYVSPDFCGHCQTLFTLPLLRHHDRSAVEIFAYSNVSVPDELTARVCEHTDAWRDIAQIDDDQAAELVRRDRIDILVDLTLHMANNRLPVFARKPAPVQVTWLAYPGTTGLRSIDYRLSDRFLDPPGTGDEFYAERTIRLPDTFWCYGPLSEGPAVNELPALRNGFVTFGCLNNPSKVSEPALDLWAAALLATPGSCLLLRASPGSGRIRIQEGLVRRGTAPGRIAFVDRQPLLKYLELYRQIDISLDTIPYTGHTTSMDSLWMGVPVVTLPGDTAVSRGGVTLLSAVGLVDLIAASAKDYARIAAQLAGDLPRLAQVRKDLRATMKTSALMHAPQFARNIEAAYRRMWNTWCRGIALVRQVT